MGVKDLWQLLSPIGRRISIETLEGKALAIDMSIWLTQFIKAMRDEEGKMIKNAHLIGTIRRILKILFHKIRPIFVFDGATPSLKANTIQRRRKTHERHESNRRAVIHKLLLNHVKSQQKERKIEQKSHTDNGQYANNFSAPPQTNTFANSSSEEKGDALSIPEEETKRDEGKKMNLNSSSVNDFQYVDVLDENIEWEGGYETLHAKDLNEENRGSDSEDEMEYNLPESYQDLSIEVLASLPVHMRKQIVEELRRKERIKSRTNYIPVADNPLLYSQTQLANFLKTSKLNRKVEAAQKFIDGDVQGKRVASEGNKKILFIPKDEPTLSRTSIEESGLSIAEDSFEEVEGRGFLTEELSPTAKKKRGLSDLRSPDKSPKRKKLQKNSSSKDIEVSQVPLLENETIGGGGGGGGGGFFVESTDDREESLQESQSDFIPSQISSFHREEHNFYDDLHNDSEAENLDDVAWEAEELSETNEIPNSEDKPEDDDFDLPFENEVNENVEGLKMFHRSNAIGLSPIMKGNQTSDLLVKTETLQSVTSLLESHPSTVSHNSTSTLDRAIATASNMADWAGRVVRKALKDHLNKEQQTLPSQTQPMTSIAAASIDQSRDQRLDETARQQSSKSRDRTLNWNEINERIAESEEEEQFLNSELDKGEEAQVTNASLILNSIEEEKERHQFLHDGPELMNFVDFAEEDENEDEDDEELKKALISSTRDTERLTEDMKNEVMDLIKAFDLPYLIAPFEAEAQCAVLEQLGLVDGVVTEDSDAFLFGSRAVYKNIFNDKKFVEVYLADDVEKELGIKREDMIALAYFLGSDYTEGVNGIGIVNAMEIIQAFPFGASEEEILLGLEKFREWLRGYDFVRQTIEEIEEKDRRKMEKQASVSTTQSKKRKKKTEVNDDEDSDDSRESEGKDMISEFERKEDERTERLVIFDKKHKSGRAKWTIPDSFPDPRVCHAYMHPMANRENEKFLWKYPNQKKVQQYCLAVLGWTEAEVEAHVSPVLKRFAEKSVQTRIDQHFMISYEDDTRFARIASDRLKSAVVQKTGKTTNLALFGAKRTAKKRKQKEDEK